MNISARHLVSAMDRSVRLLVFAIAGEACNHDNRIYQIIIASYKLENHSSFDVEFFIFLKLVKYFTYFANKYI